MSVIALSACRDEPGRGDGRRIDRPSLGSKSAAVRVVSAAEGTLLYGDTIRFYVEPVNDEDSLISVKVSMAESRRLLAEDAGGHIAIPSEQTGGGKVRLRVDADLGEGARALRYKEFTIKAAEAPREWSFEVLRRFPHDKTSFTQGLLVHDGYLYEGTGNKGESRIRKMEVETGKVLMEHEMDSDMFGEGITIFGDKLYQVTYKSAIGFIYDVEDFSKVGEWTYATYTGEGWGLTHNDTALILSDGSAWLYFIDPHTFAELGRIQAFDHRGPVDRLNELEYRDGTIYANVYTSTHIVAIDAGSGLVRHLYSARGMVDRSEITAGMDVLNGIAFHPLSGHMLITGKYWKIIYEVRPRMKDS